MRLVTSTQRTGSFPICQVRGSVTWAGLLVLATHTCPLRCPLHPLPLPRLDLEKMLTASLVPLLVWLAPRWFDGQRVAESRQGTLTEYYNALMGLPVKISRCPQLLDFFKVRPDDLKLPTDSQ